MKKRTWNGDSSNCRMKMNWVYANIVMFCNVEAELHEIGIESIDGTREVKGSRRMHYYNGQHSLKFTATII